MRRILVTGCTGQVGSELVRALMPLGMVVIPDRKTFDLENPRALAATIIESRPDVIVNAAAYTAVDKAEEQTNLAMKLNSEAPAELAGAARTIGALLVHYSSDYVFDGKSNAPYVEEDTPNPSSAYGRSKLAGEEAIRSSGADHVILRTSWVYAARGNNFLRTILRLAAEREELRIVADQIGAPTWARLIADSTALILWQDLYRRHQGTFNSGTFHLTAAGAASWHQFASAIVTCARERGAALKCRTILPISTGDYPLPAQRPHNSRLAGKKLSEHYRLEMPRWEACMTLCIEELLRDGKLHTSARS
jgi:dTDP-4-dehydrorhamnose reductase